MQLKAGGGVEGARRPGSPPAGRARAHLRPAPLCPPPGCLQDVLQRHQGDRNSLIVALTKLRNDEKKLEADAEGLNSMVQLLMQVQWGGRGRGAGRRRRCRRACRRCVAAIRALTQLPA